MNKRTQNSIFTRNDIPNYLEEKYVKHKTTDGSEVSYKTYSFEAKFKDCTVPIKFVVVFGKWSKEDDKKFHILITNQLKASPRMLSKTTYSGGALSIVSRN